jgi:hypothetical protein
VSVPVASRQRRLACRLTLARPTGAGKKSVGYIQLVIEDGKARISVTDDTLEPGAC